VNEFKSQYWPGELYLDETKAMYTAVGGGEARETPLHLGFVRTTATVALCVLRRFGAAGSPLS
jgi:hypothetical protein